MPQCRTTAGHAVAVRLQDAVDDVQVLDIRRAFIVDDHVVALGPFRVGINRVEVHGGLVGVVGDGPFDVGPGRDALGEDVLLLGVVVAAAAEDQQGLDRFGSRFVLSPGAGEAQAGDEQRSEQESAH